MWTKQHILTALQSKTTASVAGLVIGSALGASGYHFFRGKKLEAHYRRVADEEILAAKLFYAKKFKENEYSDPTELAKQYQDETPETSPTDKEIEDNQSALVRQAADILERHDYTKHSKPEQTQEELVEVQQSIKKNIFDNREPIDETEYDKAVEDAKRREGLPYIIPIGVFMSNDSGYSQSTVTYYVEDDTLVNDADIPIENYERRIGDDNLHFGRASADANIVYIRNESEEEEYEVVRNRGSFEYESTGFSHGDDRPKVMKFRSEY